MHPKGIALPDLRMLPTACLRVHEEYDPRRVEKLSRRILEEGILKNPPIVTEIPDSEDFVVMDGANRVEAFSKLHIPHIVVQRVSYDSPGVVLDTWHHVVSGIAWEAFEPRLQQALGVHLQLCSLEQAREALVQRKATAYVISAGEVRWVSPRDQQTVPDVHLMSALVNSYRGHADIFRAVNDNWDQQASLYPHITALVVFPCLQPGDILQIARNSQKLPSGITRHIVSERALNINIPLGIMMVDMPLENKRQWLEQWYRERLASNAIRYYAEATYSFNE